MAMLKLTLKKQWFDMILSGVKKEEYREIKPYWDNRLFKKKYDTIKFTNGYKINSPFFYIELLDITTGLGKTDIGGGSEIVYILKLGNIINQKGDA